MAVRQLTPVLEKSAIAIFEETDLVIAEQSLISNIKLLEGLLKTDPKNRTLLMLTCQGYSGYALGFVEDENPERARELYLRAKQYGMRILKQNNKNIDQKKSDLDQFINNLNTYDKKQVANLFWTAFSWAGYLNLSLHDPMAIVEVPRVEAMMNRVMELDSTFFYGGAQLFFGSMYGMKPRMFGGDTETAKAYFERNLRISKEKFLLTYVYLAKYYAIKTLDEEAFENYLELVETKPVELLPDMPLLNAIAKKKAKFLKKNKENYF
jgi:hypothetical protein